MFKKISLKIMLMVTASILESCGGKKSPDHRPRKEKVETKLSDEVPDLSSNQVAASAIAAQTETSTGRSPGACMEILFADGRDIYFRIKDESDLSKVRDVLCSQTESQLSHLFKESHGDAHNSSNSIGVTLDTLTPKGKYAGSFNYNQTKAGQYTSDMANQDAHNFKDAFCADRGSTLSHSEASTVFKSIISDVTLEKYNACVKSKAYGLHCDLIRSGEQVLAIVSWEPTDVVRNFLPMVALKAESPINFKLNQELPQVLGVGTGIQIQLTRIHPEQDAIFPVSAQDKSGTFVFNCQSILKGKSLQPPEPEKKKLVTKKTGRFPECGVERYNSGNSNVCGVKVYGLARSVHCGVEKYRSQRRAECGVESFNERHSCDVCGQSGFYGGCKKCANIRFGVREYKECRRDSFGVEAYNECRHPNHGVDTYESCRHPSFGIELYKECEIDDLS